MSQNTSPLGFIEIARQNMGRRPVNERLRDWFDVSLPTDGSQASAQASRCIDCGIPFCHSGCPLGNLIPEFNTLAAQGSWDSAYDRLLETNPFPEFTGRVCPAPCESACVAGLAAEPVAIEQIECAISDQAWSSGSVIPRIPARRSGRRVAVVGSGPAGLACADHLNQAGHSVTVFERADRIGGLLRYGIPDFKLEKRIVQRRVDLMTAEGISFVVNEPIGSPESKVDLDQFDAVVLCTGATRARDLPIEGRSLPGIHFAHDFLSRQNKATETAGGANTDPTWSAEGKHVIVIGGGDTGSDCVGTANRQGAISVTQFELTAVPPTSRPESQPWPWMPMTLKTSSSQEEGVDRHWSIKTSAFEGEDRVRHLMTQRVTRSADGSFNPVPDSEEHWPADMVLLAIGYTGPEPKLASALGLDLDERGCIATDSSFMTSREGFFCGGDARRGQSLVVWAIAEGRGVAQKVHAWLGQEEMLPVSGPGDLPRL